MLNRNSMKSAYLFLVVGFILSSVNINIGLIGEIEAYLSVWCYLLGFYLLRKEDRLFSICFYIQICSTFIFILSKVYLYITPIEMPLILLWIHFIMKSFQSLLMIYACHLYAPSMNYKLAIILQVILIGVIIIFQGETFDLTFGFLILSLVFCIAYQLSKCLSDVENYQMKVSLQKIPIVRMLILFFGMALGLGVIILYLWPYTAYRYVGAKDLMSIDRPLNDSIQLDNGWEGKLYKFDENSNLYVIHYQGELSKKYSFIDIQLPYVDYGFRLNNIMIGNGQQKYDYDELGYGEDHLMIWGFTQPYYRVYLNPDDKHFEINIELIAEKRLAEESYLKEMIFNLHCYEYGKVYSNGNCDIEQVIFQVRDDRWQQGSYNNR